MRAGDEAACESLYLAYHEPLWRFAYGYVRSREVAEELVQEVFLALWRGRSEYDVRSCLRAWLYASIRNLALNHLRHERVVSRLAERTTADHRTSDAWSAVRVSGEQAAVVAMGAPAPDAQATAEAEELEAAVSAALAALPERRRIAMTLRWKHDLSAAEIARVLGTSPESVRVLLSRARQELVGLIKR
ncbi:MAG TPA: sigma-70 family RNA polymerase sigma factor [Gemmatimonadaceae bacterium]|nr:sigma-70 family RNA polymerase sigma factor [Gemmatimonadaceae bacterium]